MGICFGYLGKESRIDTYMSREPRNVPKNVPRREGLEGRWVLEYFQREVKTYSKYTSVRKSRPRVVLGGTSKRMLHFRTEWRYDHHNLALEVEVAKNCIQFCFVDF